MADTLIMTSLLQLLPRGARLTPEALARRHRIVMRVLWLHVPVLVAVGLLGPNSVVEALGLPLITLALALAAVTAADPLLRCDLASAGLMSASYVGIELSGGEVAAHFHLFVILVFVALYQRWTALLVAVVSAVVHHTLVGLLAPGRVFGVEHLSTGALIGTVAFHESMVVLEVIGILLVWRRAEEVEADNDRLSAANIAAHDRVEEERLANLAREKASESERSAQLAELATGMAFRSDMILSAAQQVSSVLTGLDEKAAVLNHAVREIESRAQQAATTAARGRDNAVQAAESVRLLEQSMGEISAVNALISQLADQTNLLSLNATIEAARAGDHGRGFGVVATEVKQLANETASSSSKVSTVISSVINETKAVAASFASTSSVVSEIDTLQADIALKVAEQTSLLTQVTQDLQAAGSATREIADSVRELADSAATL